MARIKQEKRLGIALNAEDLEIEAGTLDPEEEDTFYPKGVLQILEYIFENEEFQRPRGKQSPKFRAEEIYALIEYILRKPPNIVLKAYKRLPQKHELPLRRRMFVTHLISAAQGNAAQAARLQA